MKRTVLSGQSFFVFLKAFIMARPSPSLCSRLTPTALGEGDALFFRDKNNSDEYFHKACCFTNILV